MLNDAIEIRATITRTPRSLALGHEYLALQHKQEQTTSKYPEWSLTPYRAF